ncbi:hypothetical protein [Neolewinella agarilytica]|uniref:hypothetical protein n=1 Tax=Neolewinella agarilytica TaxID=478744 RepID=UPI002353C72C|nr:hypothetical protein [Neolewinella agarilytica]
MLIATTNQYLIILAGLGWLLSLYFGFFRYRQFVWSRNKVRYDLLLKVDQRRAELASKILLLTSLGADGKRAEARVASLTRRYFQLLLQIDYYQSTDGMDEGMLEHLRQLVRQDLTEISVLQPTLLELFQTWATTQAAFDGFTATLLRSPLSEQPALCV